MPWLQLTLKTSATLAPLWGDVLSDIGATAVSFQDAKDEPLFEPDPGKTPLWSLTSVIGLFEPDIDLHKIKTDIKNHLGEEAIQSLAVETIADQDWERAWMDQFKPMQFGKNLWICPSYEEPKDPNAINIFLDPGLAFGTGTHPTTRLCLEWLDAHPPKHLTLIDYGTGSGILAIAAIKLGAAKVFAVDHDIQALQSTKENTLKNNLTEQQIVLLYPEQIERELENKEAGLQNKADLILANILANPLKDLAPTFNQLLNPGGNLVLSGVLEEQTESVLEAYSPWCKTLNISVLEGWTCITLQKYEKNH